ncbi:MAG: AAA family ATPase [Nanoarchaeota archaeon]
MDPKFQEILLHAEFEDIIGQQDAKRQVKSAFLMDRHVVIVGPPGIGKTTLAKNVAKLIPEKVVNECEFNCSPDKPLCPQCREMKEKGKKIKTRTVKGQELFVRVQGSPDLTAEDLIGDIDPIKALKFGSLSPEAFSPGKMFKANQGVLFFDEINRCSEKLQNTLLQALEEQKVTIGSYNVDFDVDFIFIGTMNPEDTSTEPLSDVFLDRFDLVYMHYPETLELELKIIDAHGKKLVQFPEKLLADVVQFIRELRRDPNIEKKPSVRASLGVYERSQSNALLKQRNAVTIQDVQDVLFSVLNHRIRLKPSIKYLTTPENYLAEEFRKFCDRGDYP